MISWKGRGYRLGCQIISDNTISALVGVAVALIITHILKHLGRVVFKIDTFTVHFASIPGIVSVDPGAVRISFRTHIFNTSEMHRVLKDIRVLIKGKKIKESILPDAHKILYLPPRNFVEEAFSFVLKDKAVRDKINQGKIKTCV